MNNRRVTMIGLISSIVCLGLLFVVYPWSLYFNNFTYGARITFVSYLLLAVFVGFVVAIGASLVLVHGVSRMPAIGQGAIVGTISFTLLFIGSLLLGPTGIDIPDTRIRGIFFSEWKFGTFDGLVALPIAVVGATLVWWAVRRRG